MQDGGGLVGFLPLLLIFLIFYLAIVRPQRKQRDQHRTLLQSLRPGDEVMTVAGIYGTVREIRDDDLVVEIAPGTTVRMVLGAVRTRVEDDSEAAEGDDPQ